MALPDTFDKLKELLAQDQFELLLDEEKKEGVAVVYVGEDLDVLIDLCDRILVLCGGKENGILDARTTTKEEVGLLMTNLRKEGK